MIIRNSALSILLLQWAAHENKAFQTPMRPRRAFGVISHRREATIKKFPLASYLDDIQEPTSFSDADDDDYPIGSGLGTVDDPIILGGKVAESVGDLSSTPNSEPEAVVSIREQVAPEDIESINTEIPEPMSLGEEPEAIDKPEPVALGREEPEPIIEEIPEPIALGGGEPEEIPELSVLGGEERECDESPEPIGLVGEEPELIVDESPQPIAVEPEVVPESILAEEPESEPEPEPEPISSESVEPIVVEEQEDGPVPEIPEPADEPEPETEPVAAEITETVDPAEDPEPELEPIVAETPTEPVVVDEPEPEPEVIIEEVSEAIAIHEETETEPTLGESSEAPVVEELEPLVAETPEPIIMDKVAAEPEPTAVVEAVSEPKIETPPPPPKPVYVRPERTPREKKGGALVPISDETVQFTAGVLGGAVGLVTAGPMGAAVGAMAANYLAKKEAAISDAVQGVSTSAIKIYNYMTKLEEKLEVLEATQDTLEATLDRLKEADGVNAEAVDKVEEAIRKTTSKIGTLAKEYDVWSAAYNALDVVGGLVEKSVDTVGQVTKEYNVVERFAGFLKDAAVTAKIAVEKAQQDAASRAVIEPPPAPAEPVKFVQEPVTVEEPITSDPTEAVTEDSLDEGPVAFFMTTVKSLQGRFTLEEPMPSASRDTVKEESPEEEPVPFFATVVQDGNSG